MKTYRLALVLFFSLLAKSEQNGTLTAEGQERLKRNSEILSQNLVDAQHNLEISKTNQTTLDTELKELEKIQNEHRALDKRYQDLLLTTQKEIEKNEKAMRDLVFYEEKARKIPVGSRAPNYQQQLEASRQERQNREDWKKGALERQFKLNQNRVQISKNMHQVDARKIAIQKQLENWKNKEKSYLQLVAEVKNRQAETERISRNNSGKSP